MSNKVLPQKTWLFY